MKNSKPNSPNSPNPKPDNWPSKVKDHPSGPGRDNNPPKVPIYPISVPKPTKKGS